MSKHGGLLCGAALMVFLLVAGQSVWAMSPRYTLLGRALIVQVEAPNLLTVKMQGKDRLVNIRLLGVGSPRNRDRIRGLEPQLLTFILKKDLWEEARSYVRSLLDGKVVEVWARKLDRKDDKQRLLAYIVIPTGSSEPMDLNADIIKKGLGFVTRDYVHVTFADYKQLEEEARKNRRGIWRGLSMDWVSSLRE
ncbi:MAG: thermonuclease family protein [Desulfomonile tiedjei]|nr:thermonuclease family protein [Desulfomonile tiedjei]